MDLPIKPGSIWRAKNRFATFESISLVDDTESMRPLVERIEAGSELRMAESILLDYELTTDSESE